MVLVNCIYAEDRVKSKEKSAIGFGNIMNKVGFDRVHNDRSRMSMTLVTMLNSHVHSRIHGQIYRKQTQTCCVPQKLFANLDELAMMETIGLWYWECWKLEDVHEKKEHARPTLRTSTAIFGYVCTHLPMRWRLAIYLHLFFWYRGVPTIPYLSEKQTSYHEEMIYLQHWNPQSGLMNPELPNTPFKSSIPIRRIQ